MGRIEPGNFAVYRTELVVKAAASVQSKAKEVPMPPPPRDLLDHHQFQSFLNELRRYLVTVLEAIKAAERRLTEGGMQPPAGQYPAAWRVSVEVLGVDGSVIARILGTMEIYVKGERLRIAPDAL